MRELKGSKGKHLLAPSFGLNSCSKSYIGLALLLVTHLLQSDPTPSIQYVIAPLLTKQAKTCHVTCHTT